MSGETPPNQYWRQLTPEHIAAGEHRRFVGGMWEEIGELQFRFLENEGLRAHHRLLDVGCGALRGGVRFVRYLDPGNYYGLDLNASLIEAGRVELDLAGLSNRGAHLLADDSFRVDRFGTRFDFALAVSLFTHLPMNQIGRCLARVGEVLEADGVFYATFFQAPAPLHLDTVTHEPGGVVTNYDKDPYHYAFDEMRWIGDLAGLQAELIGEWGHQRGQKMLRFVKAP